MSNDGFQQLSKLEALDEVDSEPLGVDKEKIQEAIDQHQSPLRKDVEAEEAAKADEFNKKADAAAKDREMADKFDRDRRLEQLRKSDDINEFAPLFLMDMAGASQMVRTYKPVPWVTIEFQTMTADMVNQVGVQTSRDLIVGRYLFTDEPRFDLKYRLGAMLKSYQMTDPQESGKVLVHYDFEASLVDIEAEDFKELGEDAFIPQSDTLVRRRSLYITHKVLKNATAYGNVSNVFQEFDNLIADLMFLSQEDPDFFLDCLGKDT
jgi:hypothetical protein